MEFAEPGPTVSKPQTIDIGYFDLIDIDPSKVFLFNELYEGGEVRGK